MIVTIFVTVFLVVFFAAAACGIAAAACCAFIVFAGVDHSVLPVGAALGFVGCVCLIAYYYPLHAVSMFVVVVVPALVYRVLEYRSGK